MQSLKKSLARYLRPTPNRVPDQFRKSRPLAKALAQTYGIEIEALRPGFNVWPPKAIADTDADEFNGNHYAEDWNEVLKHVQTYVKAITAKPETAAPVQSA